MAPAEYVTAPPWHARLCATACYFGLAPVLRLARRRGDSFFDHHATSAALLWLLLNGLIAASLLYLAGISAAMIYARDLYEQLPNVAGLAPPQRDAIPTMMASVAWLAMVVVATVLAASGSRWPLPLIGRFMRRPRWVRAAWLANTFSLVVASFIAAIAAHATLLTRDDTRPAALYVLYDDMALVPRWAMSVGFYRLARAGEDRWGPRSVVVARLDEPHLHSALEHGRVVFLACHGADGGIVGSNFWVKPASAVAPVRDDQPARGVYMVTTRGGKRRGTWIAPGTNLRLVYNTACDSGRLGDDWSRSLAPAEVKTFDRLSLVAEHLSWALFTGPRLLRDETWRVAAPGGEVEPGG
ncbi:MAG TPA: hypothetical protein VG826_18530 [Pirellulales bacterium]|nr:hypothetical protein [Pirellulales bacterium]